MKINTVVVGLVLIVVGIIFGWLCCLPGILIIVGLVVMLIGLVQSEKPPTVVYQMGPAPYQGYQPQEPIQVQQTTGQGMFCPYCGSPRALNTVYCPSCGNKPSG